VPRENPPRVRAPRWRLSAVAFAATASLLAITAHAGSAAQPVARPSGSGQLVALPGHVHGLAQPRFDMGEAPSSLHLGALELDLARTPAQTQALEQLLAAQQDPKSPQYHQWLTPAAYGARFGASEAAVAALSRWLQGNGLRVEAPPASRSRLRFHGTKTQVETAFHTYIHEFAVDGVNHFANVSPPEVPATLATLITAVHGLHDFYPTTGIRSRRAAAAATQTQPQTTYDAGKENFVGPGDFATIYNLLPLHQAGGNGAGVTIAIAGESDIDLATASAFWSGFGLSTPPFNSMPVPGGQDPGQTNDNNELEAYVDVEIAGSVAQGATLLLVRDKDALNAAAYVIEQNLAAILNISFGACESNIGAQNSVISSLFQQAVAQGITVTVSAGDSGVAACASDFAQGQLSTSGFAVNGVASTAYDLAVGGTEFNPTQTQDWATGNAAGTLTNALAHIPEMVWNDSCANPLWASALGFASTDALCNTATLNGQPNPFLEVAGGGGGLSSCIAANGSACTGGYPQPSWQTGVAGIQSFGVRVIPDVVMVATPWVVCSYDVSPCDPATENVDLVAGTSAAAPSVAAIIAILDQGMSTPASPDGRQGLINPQLYSLAAAEYGSPQSPNNTASACSATLGSGIGAGCVFYNVTAGSNAMPCQVSAYNAAGSLPASTCMSPSGQANGIMQINSTPDYPAVSGFNLATGLGSINAGNLVLAIYLPAPSGLVASATAQTVDLSWSAEPHATSFNVYQGTQSGQEGPAPVLTGSTGSSAAVPGLQYGQSYYFTVAAESAIGLSGRSNEAHVTIVPATPAGLSASAGNGSVSLTWTAATGAKTYNLYAGTSPGAEGAAPLKSAIAGTNTTATGLTNGTTYYFTVAGVDPGGVSARSAEAQATPAAPGGGGALGSLELALLALLAVVRTLARGAAAPPRMSSG
jgi:subtilase family serine protease